MTDDTQAIIAAILDLGSSLRAEFKADLQAVRTELKEEIQDARREAKQNAIGLRLMVEDQVANIQHDISSLRRSIFDVFTDHDNRLTALERKTG